MLPQTERADNLFGRLGLSLYNPIASAAGCAAAARRMQQGGKIRDCCNLARQVGQRENLARKRLDLGAVISAQAWTSSA